MFSFILNWFVDQNIYLFGKHFIFTVQIKKLRFVFGEIDV